MSSKESDNLIIMNPNSGTFNGHYKLKIFIDKYFSNGFNKLFISNTEDDLNDVINQINDFKNILVVGGDGTLFSLIQRVIDKDIVIGHIPTGSGNGLTNSLLYTKNIKLSSNLDKAYINLRNAVDNNSTNKIDTMTIKLLNSKKTVHSFLFLSCGIFSNLDLNTEWMRRLGELRFILGAIYELIKYFLFGSTISGVLEYKDDNDTKILEIGQFAFFLANNMSHTSRTTLTSPFSKPDDGYIYISYLKEPTNTWTLLKVLLGLEDGSYINNLKYVRTKWFKFTPSNGIYDIDGEKYNIEPVEVSINPKSLTFLY